MHPFQLKMIESELADIVGRDYVLTNESDRIIYGVDYMWLPRLWIDRGQVPPLPDIVVLPETPEQVAANRDSYTGQWLQRVLQRAT